MRLTVCNIMLLCTVMHNDTGIEGWKILHDEIRKTLDKHDKDYTERGLRKDVMHITNAESVRVHLSDEAILKLIEASQEAARETGASKWLYLSDVLQRYV